MGLDTSHDAWHGAYGAFSRFRNEVAQVAGYDVLPVTYPDGSQYATVLIDWGHLPRRCYQGDWAGQDPEDPLLYLVAHSDCDGHLKPEACGRLADRLEELLPEISKLPDDGGHIGVWREKTLKLIKGLRLAAANNERLEFH